MVMGTDVRALYAKASGPAQALALAVLEQDLADQQWATHLGPALSQADAARLLGVSVQAVSKNRGLLRIRNRDGRVVYPVLQFDGRRVLPGLAEVLALLDGPLLPLTVASWLMTAASSLADRTPVEALRDGELDAVRRLAQQTVTAAG